MALTHDYLDFLDAEVEISPANSQEELQAAEVIRDLMAQHGVDAAIEEFSAPRLGGLYGAIVACAMFVGVVLSGVGVLPLALLGLVLAVVPTVLLGLSLTGRHFDPAFGPAVRSQNVVAVHRACGPRATHQNHPVVVCAHYDSPHENFLRANGVAQYVPAIAKAAKCCVPAVAVCALLQLLAFIPAPVRLVLWLAGIVAAVPALVMAIAAIAERMMPCTVGANDNKASVAALLGVLENVRPSGIVPKPRPEAPAHDAEQGEAQPDDGLDGDVTVEEPADGENGQPLPAEPVPVQPVLRYEEVVGVRHGEDVLRSLGMLPETCQIEYVAPQLVEDPVATAAAQAQAQAQSVAPAGAPAADLGATSDLGSTSDLGATSPMAAVPQDRVDADVSPVTRDDLLAGDRFGIVADDEPRGVGRKDHSGLDVVDLPDDPDVTAPAPAPRPSAPDDREWGKSSYEPSVSDMARRASLFDLPDPSAVEDPFAAPQSDVHAAAYVPPVSAQPAPAPQAAAPARPQQPVAQQAPAQQPVAQQPVPEPIETLSAEPQPEEKPKNRIQGFFERIKRHEGQPQADGWLGHDDDDDNPLWRGGATTRAGLRLVGEDEGQPAVQDAAADVDADVAGEQGQEQAPTEEDLRDAVLGLQDDELLARDIWFVALGSSSLGHAGMKSFLAAHGEELASALFINLDCIGAGSLAVLGNEGLVSTRTANSRVCGLVKGAIEDLHGTCAVVPHDWEDTDATPAMRSYLRAATVMGVVEHNVAALSHSKDDVMEYVDGDQADFVAQAVTEAIRRS